MRPDALAGTTWKVFGAVGAWPPCCTLRVKLPTAAPARLNVANTWLAFTKSTDDAVMEVEPSVRLAVADGVKLVPSISTVTSPALPPVAGEMAETLTTALCVAVTVKAAVAAAPEMLWARM